MYKILLQRNIIKKVAALRENYLNISVTLVTDLEEILLSISRMVFQKVNKKSSEVCKKQNEKREIFKAAISKKKKGKKKIKN